MYIYTHSLYNDRTRHTRADLLHERLARHEARREVAQASRNTCMNHNKNNNSNNNNKNSVTTTNNNNDTN